MFDDDLEAVREMGREDGEARSPPRDPTEWLDEEFGYAEAKLEAYADAYGYAFGYQDGIEGDFGSGWKNGFENFFFPWIAHHSDTARDAYRRGFDDGWAERGEDDDEDRDDSDSSDHWSSGDYGGSGGDSSPINWRSCGIALLIVLGALIVIGSMVKQMLLARQSPQPETTYPEPSAEPFVPEPPRLPVPDPQANAALPADNATETPEPSTVIGFAPSEEQKRRDQLKALAYQRFQDASQAAYKRSEDIILNTDCYRNPSVCEAAMNQRYIDLRKAEAQYELDRSRIARGEDVGWDKGE